MSRGQGEEPGGGAESLTGSQPSKSFMLPSRYIEVPLVNY